MLSGVLAGGRARFSVPHPIQTHIYTRTFANPNPTAPRFPPLDNVHRLPLGPSHSVLLLLISSVVAAVNFTQCLDDFKNDPNATGGVDFRGHPTSPSGAAGFTYKNCAARCGANADKFSWREFAQLFASWLLPWLTLTG